jgi:hypothetical protein
METAIWDLGLRLLLQHMQLSLSLCLFWCLDTLCANRNEMDMSVSEDTRLLEWLGYILHLGGYTARHCGVEKDQPLFRMHCIKSELERTSNVSYYIAG